eukprot:7359579-Pyramimonas_sp.AAC.1
MTNKSRMGDKDKDIRIRGFNVKTLTLVPCALLPESHAIGSATALPSREGRQGARHDAQALSSNVAP